MSAFSVNAPHFAFAANVRFPPFPSKCAQRSNLGISPAIHGRLPALSRPWPHGPNAAARPVKAVVRAPSAMFGNLRSYGAAMKVIGNTDRQETGRWLNNRAENSHQPFRRRERAMLRFRRMRTLQKFVAVHASVHNHFNQERHLYNRSNFKLNRAAALTEWRGLGVA
jgi:hypothetical protein